MDEKEILLHVTGLAGGSSRGTTSPPTRGTPDWAVLLSLEARGLVERMRTPPWMGCDCLFRCTEKGLEAADAAGGAG